MSSGLISNARPHPGQLRARFTSLSPYLPFGANPCTRVASQLAPQLTTLIGQLIARRFQLIPTRDGSTGFRVRARARNKPSD